MFPDNLLARTVLLTASRVLALAFAVGSTTTSITAGAASSSAVAGSTAADMQYEPVPDAAHTAHAVVEAAAAPADFASLARQCAPDVHPALLGRASGVARTCCECGEQRQSVCDRRSWRAPCASAEEHD
jgi:type IV secretion system protein VirB1